MHSHGSLGREAASPDLFSRDAHCHVGNGEWDDAAGNRAFVPPFTTNYPSQHRAPQDAVHSSGTLDVTIRAAARSLTRRCASTREGIMDGRMKVLATLA